MKKATNEEVFRCKGSIWLCFPKQAWFNTFIRKGFVLIATDPGNPSTYIGNEWELFEDWYYLRANSVGDGIKLGEELPNM